MKHDTIRKLPTSARVLDIETTDVARFVQKCVQERSLSVLVKELNHDYLFGTAEERDSAEQALRHMGFV